MTILFGLIADFLAGLFFIGAGTRTSRSHDRNLLREGRVRSALRSVSGRVLDVGTEWSSGVSTLAPGHVTFVPSVGIVGARRIEILGLREAGIELKTPQLGGAGLDENTTLIIETEAGELYWSVPKHLARDVYRRITLGDANASDQARD